MIRFSLLSSGSSGNSILVTTGSSKILIDDGLSYKQLRSRAEQVGENLDDLDAVFVTHEHGDHVNGLGTLSRRQGTPVFMTRGTHENLPKSVGALRQVELFEAGESIAVDGLTMRSFNVSHDAADPVGFVAESAGAKLGLAADLGHCSQLVRVRLAGVQGLILESNYCPDLLRKGSYPPAVQQRIRGRRGHLSNADMRTLLTGLVHDALQIVVLTHISEENNTRQLAYECALEALRDRPVKVHMGRQNEPTGMFEIRP